MKMNSHRISVIIPVYNVEAYLERCLQSVVNQTYKNLEIIIVNDCSPDNCEGIITSLASKDKRIKYIRHSANQGLGPARNTGINAASGEMIGFVDSDDYIAPDMYETLHNNLIKTKADLAICGVNRESEGKLSSFVRIEKSKTLTRCECYRSLMAGSKQLSSYAWNKLYYKNTFKEKGIKFPSILYEDLPTFFKVLSHVDKVCFVPNALYFYQIREGAITNKPTSRHFVDRKEALNLISLHYNSIKESRLTSVNELSFQKFQQTCFLSFFRWVRPHLRNNEMSRAFANVFHEEYCLICSEFVESNKKKRFNIKLSQYLKTTLGNMKRPLKLLD